MEGRRARGDTDRFLRSDVRGEVVLEICDFLSQDEAGVVHDALDCRIDFRSDGAVLRFEIHERNLHDGLLFCRRHSPTFHKPGYRRDL